MRRVADKYAEYEKVILIGHGMSFRTLTYIEEMKPAEIVECKYEIGNVSIPFTKFTFVLLSYLTVVLKYEHTNLSNAATNRDF